MTEAEMREATVPTPKSPEDLATYVDSLIAQEHDYGTCVYAMSMAAIAAFNLVADKLGVTGFQASFADMDILRRSRGWKGPAMVLDLANHLYPQYDLVGDVQKAIDKNAKWFRDEAVKLLADKDELVHADVAAHWRKLAAAEVTEEAS